MHFALPPRKTSAPPPYTRIKSVRTQRRTPYQIVIYVVLGILSIYFLWSRWLHSHGVESDGEIGKITNVVLVTVVDESHMSEEQIGMIQKNREDYAARHGYNTFFTNVSTYNHLTSTSPSSWALIPALRHALTLFPESDYLWALTPRALITNSSLSLHDHIFSRLSDIILKDIPVVPPDSVIRTFSHLKPSQVHMIISQDMDNVAHTSFLLRNSARAPVAAGQPKDNWSQYLLDAWFDPLYRAYAFQKAENHALEHIIQWHPTLLAKLAIIDQRLINSYNFQSKKKTTSGGKVERVHDSKWQAGDFVINFKGCDTDSERDCDKEMRHFYEKWEKIFLGPESTQNLHVQD